MLSQLTVTRVSDPQPVGLVVLYNASLQSGTGYLGVVVAPECVGSGVGAEAAMLFLRYVFHTWDLTKVYMEFPEFNLAQFASGVDRYFRVEGRLRSHYYYGGRRFDQIIAAVYRDEFLQLIEEGIRLGHTRTSLLTDGGDPR